MNFYTHVGWFKYDPDWWHYEAHNSLSFSFPTATRWTNNSLVCIAQTLAFSTRLTECWICLPQDKPIIGHSDVRFPFSYNLPFLSHTNLCYIFPSVLLSSILLQSSTKIFLSKKGDWGQQIQILHFRNSLFSLGHHRTMVMEGLQPLFTAKRTTESTLGPL